MILTNQKDYLILRANICIIFEFFFRFVKVFFFHNYTRLGKVSPESFSASIELVDEWINVYKHHYAEFTKPQPIFINSPEIILSLFLTWKNL